MGKYQIPFTETINGYYIIEAESKEEALQLLDEGVNFDDFDEIVRDGSIDYDEALLKEIQ